MCDSEVGFRPRSRVDSPAVLVAPDPAQGHQLDAIDRLVTGQFDPHEEAQYDHGLIVGDLDADEFEVLERNLAAVFGERRVQGGEIVAGKRAADRAIDAFRGLDVDGVGQEIGELRSACAAADLAHQGRDLGGGKEGLGAALKDIFRFQPPDKKETGEDDDDEWNGNFFHGTGAFAGIADLV